MLGMDAKPSFRKKINFMGSRTAFNNVGMGSDEL
jgi:hypothetical protein